MMNYRNERDHDDRLIELSRELDRLHRIDILEGAFGVSGLGKLQHAQRRKLFDVELRFIGASLVVETKVDSDEAGRWQPYPLTWQTERIWQRAQALRFLNARTHFFFVTYGTAEFYTKHYECGPASSNFKHIGLDGMIELVDAALQLAELSANPRLQCWLSAMKKEAEKRRNAADLLTLFANFRRGYLAIQGVVDFPRNRLLFCAPELAFPVFNRLRALWNTTPQYHGKHGRLSVYPVQRGSPPVHDSVLNFRERTHGDLPPLGSTIIRNGEVLFFEINEDFNLHLKLWVAPPQPGLQPSLRGELCNAVYQRLSAVSWPNGIRGERCCYEQAVFVLYEWDFGFLDTVRDNRQTADSLATTVNLASQALS
ncbi:MAG TPA: hypothetical protein VMG10_11595 [Gemmataceae bacterium]|nr:hypothetical protein [Gemmataceae bacterium]